MKKIYFILLIAVIGLTGKSWGQLTCQTAILINPTDSIKRNEIPITDTVYWVKFIATDTSIYLGMQVLAKDSISYSKMTLYDASNLCTNYTKITESQNGIYLHYGNLLVGNTYFIKLKHNENNVISRFLTYYSGLDKALSVPNSNIFNISIQSTFCVGTILTAPGPQGCNYYCNWSVMTHSTIPSPYTILLYCDCIGIYFPQIIAQNSQGISTTNYTLTITTFPNFTFTNSICPAIVNFLGSTCIVNNPTYSQYCSYWWDFGDGMTTTPNNSLSINHTYTSLGNFVATLHVVYNNPFACNNTGCTKTEQISYNINVNFIEMFLQKPIISGNINNCTSITSYYVANPQNNTTYNWVITPQSAGNIIAGQGTPNITVEWNFITTCETKLKVTASSICADSISSILNIYPCCQIGTLHLNNINNLTTSYTNETIDVNGDLHITANVIIDNCTVRLSPYAKIIIEPGVTLELINGTELTSNRCCSIMWDGIYLSSNTSSLIASSVYGNTTSPTTIENSINGIVATNNSTINIQRVKFSNNLSSISIKNYLPQQSNVIIASNHFMGGVLIEPYSGDYSRYGIHLENADNIDIGVNNYGNEFDNLFCGIYSLNSYIKVINNYFNNIQENNANPPSCYTPPNPTLVCKPTAIHSAHTFTNAQTIINAPKIIEIINNNSLQNCQNGIKVYNEKAIITNNEIRAVSYAIDVLDPLNYSDISNNTINKCTSTGIYPYFGINVLKTQPTFLNLDISNNTVYTRGNGIYVGNCKSERVSIYKVFHVDIMRNTVKAVYSNNAIKGITVQNCLSSYVKCNTIDRANAALPTEPMANILHGISVEQTQNAEIQQNLVKYMGAGINVYGCASLTKFNCNLLNSDFYGFLFNQHASISNQGDKKNRTDSQFLPNGNYSGTYGAQNVERKFWALNSNLPSGTASDPAVKWWVFDNSYLLDPQNNIGLNPTNPRIIVNYTEPDAQTSCALGCTPSPASNMTVEEREEKFGAIVRDELQYPDLNEQYRAYNRYVLYQTLKENQYIIYLGGSDDNIYEDFYNNQQNGNIGRFDEIETLIAEGNIDQAQVTNNQVIDSSIIVNNQKEVNSIYLTTFARDIYELTSSQYQTLYDIATNYTPWEGGEGVYIARYMLGIDIDYSNPNVQFNKGQGGIADIEFFTVFPNPASDRLTLSFANVIEGGYILEVYNHTGVKVLSEVINQAEAVHQLNTTKLKNGIYFISVRTNTETFKSKFIIIK